jgi:hypothetical protein
VSRLEALFFRLCDVAVGQDVFVLLDRLFGDQGCHDVEPRSCKRTVSSDPDPRGQG